MGKFLSRIEVLFLFFFWFYRILRIIADDAENPRRKVLEMSELDGLKILERYYGSSPETMLENVHVTDERITLKGLEKGSFE